MCEGWVLESGSKVGVRVGNEVRGCGLVERLGITVLEVEVMQGVVLKIGSKVLGVSGLGVDGQCQKGFRFLGSGVFQARG